MKEKPMSMLRAAAALLTLAALACGAEFSQMDTERLLELRGSLQAPVERRELHAELQRRLPTMSPEQLERFLDSPRSRANRGRGMGDGRIATH
jgi:hypothetical protein